MSLNIIKVVFLSALFFSSSVSANEKNIAPAFGLENLDEKQVNLSDYKGKVVYLDFWATWCVPCRKSFPWMNDISEKHKANGLEVIAVSLDDKKNMVKTFLKKYPANFTILLDPEGTTADLYKVRVMPSSYIINRNGQIVESHMGFREKDKKKLEEQIQKALLTH